ncbi:MAG TPA: PDZ domain-containing protein [Candidatus Dormibacteraeota bacterium]|nr:PDZ domain-containing protein [Candidatus Dormibacteraeota bacterium]
MAEKGYLRYPTIRGDRIVFAAEDDLWSVEAGGGVARRLTTAHGECSHPRISPDGSTLAFVGRDEGYPEVYAMPVDGGPARRLTFLGSALCIVSGWQPDGGAILFTSNAGEPFGTITQPRVIAPTGGDPLTLAYGPARTISLSPEGGVLLGRNNFDPATWKRYRGGTAGVIWIDPDGSGTFRELVRLKGNLSWPMWLGGRVFFLSDHEGIGNIYSADVAGTDVRRHTDCEEYYARFPSTDGRRIVYAAGGEIFVYDPARDESARVEIETPSTAPQTVRRFVPGAPLLESYAPHPEGHSLALIARGQPYTMAHWEEGVLHHGKGSGVRYRLAEWLHDGKRIVVVSDEGGRETFEVHHVDGSVPPREVDPTLAGDAGGGVGRAVELAVSPVSEVIAIANYRQEVMLVDLAAGTARRVDRSPGAPAGDLAFSPDGRWLAYTWAPQHDLSIIRIAEVETGELHDVTTPLRTDVAPAWDPEGQYLYFLSTREFNPVYDALQFDLGFPLGMRPFAVTLRAETRNPFVPRPRPVVAREGHDAKHEHEDEPKPVRVEIDFEGIAGRLLAFPVEEGRYEQIAAAKGRALFTQVPLRGALDNGGWADHHVEAEGTLHAYDFEEQRAAAIAKDVTDFRVAADHETVIYRSGDRLRALDGSEKLPENGDHDEPDDEVGRRTGWVDLDRLQVNVDPRAEWSQMYGEAWRLQREHFWDERMSDVDWDVVFRRYARLLPRIRTRGELSDLLWEMQGELGTSHAYEGGGDVRRPPQYALGFLGADLRCDERGGYRIERIVRGDSWAARLWDSPLAEPGVNVRPGDVILAVNGHTVSREHPPAEFLVNTGGAAVTLRVRAADGSERQVVVRTLNDERPARYRAWVEENRARVHAATDGRIGYLHIPDMGPWGYAEFHRGYLAELGGRDGLIVDARYNRGGHVSPLLLEKLARKRVGYDVSRWGPPQAYPPESVAGPIVGLTNEFAGSDGDIFSHVFKLYKLGPLVGKRTWGGVIGIWPRHALVDGTVTTQPEFSFWFSDVQWSVENYGTDPDVEVEIAPQDYAAGRDPQLEKAIALAVEALEKQPVTMPAFDRRPHLGLPKLPPRR